MAATLHTLSLTGCLLGLSLTCLAAPCPGQRDANVRWAAALREPTKHKRAIQALSHAGVNGVQPVLAELRSWAISPTGAPAWRAASAVVDASPAAFAPHLQVLLQLTPHVPQSSLAPYLQALGSSALWFDGPIDPLREALDAPIRRAMDEAEEADALAIAEALDRLGVRLVTSRKTDAEQHLTLLEAPDPLQRIAACELLADSGSLPQRAIEALRRAAIADHPQSRAARRLRRSESGRPTVLWRRVEVSAQVQTAAARALLTQAREPRDHTLAHATILRRGSRNECTAALEWFAMRNPPAEDCLPVLISVLGDPEATGLREAVSVITGLGEAAVSARPALEQLLRTGGRDLQDRVLVALRRIGGGD